MSKEKEEPDFQELYQAVEIEIRNYRENIKDARRAGRNCPKDERRMYCSVVKYNQKQLREAKVKRRMIEMRTSSTWWLWIVVLALCILLMVLFPGASIALIFSPLWIVLAIGFVVVMFFARK